MVEIELPKIDPSNKFLQLRYNKIRNIHPTKYFGKIIWQEHLRIKAIKYEVTYKYTLCIGKNKNEKCAEHTYIHPRTQCCKQITSKQILWPPCMSHVYWMKLKHTISMDMLLFAQNVYISHVTLFSCLLIYNSYKPVLT